MVKYNMDTKQLWMTSETKEFRKDFYGEQGFGTLVVVVSYDGKLTITAKEYLAHYNPHRETLVHENNRTVYLHKFIRDIFESKVKINLHFKELSYLLPWINYSKNGPDKYFENTLAHARDKNYNWARKYARWPEATDAELNRPDLVELLEMRLPALMKEFKQIVESLGFTY